MENHYVSKNGQRQQIRQKVKNKANTGSVYKILDTID